MDIKDLLYTTVETLPVAKFFNTQAEYEEALKTGEVDG